MRKLLALLASLALLVSACGGETADDGAEGQPAPEDPGEDTTAEAELEPLSLTVGIHTHPSWHRLLAFYDEEHQIFRETAAEYGYDLEPNWLVAGFAADVFAGVDAGEIDIGATALYPLINQWAQGRELLPLTVPVARWPFMLVVNEDSPITDFEDLRGATIGVVVGSQLQSVVDTFLEFEFGQSAEELGITYVQQVPGVGDSIPRGIDAVSTDYSSVLPAIVSGSLEPLIVFSGVEGGAVTGSAYDGPLGQGEGIQVPSAAETPFQPEGFTALRHVMFTIPEFLDEHPDAVEAFVVAHQRIVQALAQMTPQELGDLYPDSWWEDFPRDEYQELAIAFDLIYERGWVWPTEQEVEIIQNETDFLQRTGAIDETMSFEEVVVQWSRTVPLLQRAYERVGEPAAEEFTTPTENDSRGRPVWELVDS